MMRFVASLLLGLAVSTPAPGADVTLDWIAERNGGTAMVLADDDGFSYVTTGVHLLKYDSDGNEQWVVALDTVSGTRSVGKWIDLDPEGNILVLGVNSAIANGFLTMKFDTDGNKLWESLLETTINAKRIATDAAGNSYVLGTTPNATLTGYVTAKYDADGNLQWRNVLEVGPINRPRALAVSPAGEVAVTGEVNIPGNEYDIVTVLYETDGTERWVRSHSATIPGGGQDQGNGVVFGPEGEVYVAGHSENVDFAPDMTLIKYDPAGNEQWVRHYDGPSHQFDTALWTAVDSGGNVTVVGQSDGDVALLEYDANGDLLWVQHDDGGWGGQNYVTHMVLGPDDAVYVAGQNGVQFVLALKYDTLGQFQWRVHYDIPGTFPDRATAVAIDAGNNVVLGVKYPVLAIHYLQADCALGVPPEIGGVAIDPGMIHWTPGMNGEQYDVARGDLGALGDGAPIPCIAAETANPFLPDPDVPPPGGAFGYVVRGRNVCGTGSWGDGTQGQARASVCP